ncbi:MAG: hypothetical protein ACYS99_11760 [Planctomycetota bacterium]|jgi:hypothetical protein
MTVAQTGGDLSIDMTVDPGGDDELWALSGSHGNGHLWAKGMFREGKGPMMFIGHVRRNGSRMKGRGIVGLEEDVAAVQMKVIARRSK